MLELTSYDRWCTGVGRLDVLHQKTENEKNRAHENETQAVRNLNYIGNEAVAQN